MRMLVLLAILGVLSTAYWAKAQVDSGSNAEHADHESHVAAGGAKPVDMSKQMQTMNKMMVQHLGKADPQYDARFIDMMIPHHEGAVMMAQHALKHSERPELKAMAQKVIKDQQKEIEQLKAWRKSWYGEQSAGPRAAR